MSSKKLFIGRKVRSLRESAKLTQAGFATRLGISSSYLNQIENNQRPVSAGTLVALVENFNLNMSDLVGSESDRLLSALAEALKDPLFANYDPGLQELKLVAQNAPGFAHALLRAHEAYRQNSEQLAGLDDTLGRSGLIETTPYEEVRDFFHFVDNYIDRLDTAAERLSDKLRLSGSDPLPILTDFLGKQHKVKVVRGDGPSGQLRRYDSESRVLTINPYAPPATRAFQVAFHIGEVEAAKLVEDVLTEAAFRTSEAKDICRIGLYNYYAAALLMPYEQFHKAAATLRHDLELLSGRFAASIEQVAHRLSTLQRPSMRGVPVFFARVDRAGNITKRHSATKLQFARFGSACPLWNIHQAFEGSERIIRQLAQTPDGARYLSIALQIEKTGMGFQSESPKYAIAIGCEISYAGSFVYADTLDVGNLASFKPIGVSCRVCERTNCVQRAVPPLKRRLEVDHTSRGTLPYRIVDFS